MTDFSGVDIWKVMAALQNPMGSSAGSLGHNVESPSVDRPSLEKRRDAARRELLARGLSQRDVDRIEQRDPDTNRIVTDFLAGGGPRYGFKNED